MNRLPLRIRALVVAVLGAIALMTSPRRAMATPFLGCGQCVSNDICLIMGATFCYQSCGGVGSSGVACYLDSCGTGLAWIDCGDPE
jgi:hypothetical protein